MTTPITLSLPSDQPRPLRRAAATLVTVRSGTVWLTEPDALDDRFLAAGDSHRITSHALVLIEAQHGVAEVVLVARGGDGNVLASAEGVWHAEALRVPIVSRVGAGDSFVAGFTLARARGEALPEALAWGAACASAACMTPATELCRPEDVEMLRLGGSVTPLD